MIQRGRDYFISQQKFPHPMRSWLSLKPINIDLSHATVDKESREWSLAYTGLYFTILTQIGVKRGKIDLKNKNSCYA